MSVHHHLSLGIVLLVASMASAAWSEEPQPDPTTITCTNPVSGTSWLISIDRAKNTVDSRPAQISATKITWHDAGDNSDYELDRSSGNLTRNVPSSTGGAIFSFRCTGLSAEHR